MKITQFKNNKNIGYIDLEAVEFTIDSSHCCEFNVTIRWCVTFLLRGVSVTSLIPSTLVSSCICSTTLVAAIISSSCCSPSLVLSLTATTSFFSRLLYRKKIYCPFYTLGFLSQFYDKNTASMFKCVKKELGIKKRGTLSPDQMA